MHVGRNLALLRSAGPALADAAVSAGLDAPVPSCPGWRVSDLLRHVGMVHRWANAIVAEARPGPVVEPARPADDDLVGWVRAGHATLVDSLAVAPADLDCWSFLPSPSPLAFWTRRQSHETAIHRVDAALATGETVTFETDVAADGVDELLTGFLPRPSSGLHLETERSLVVHALDAGRHWHVTIGPGTPRTVVGGGAEPSGDCVVRGTANELYLLLWNRRNRIGLAVDGDAALLDRWRRDVKVSWR